MLNKLLCWMWGHVWIKELEGFTYSFPIQVLPGKWIMDKNEAAMHGHFNFEEIEATYTKMKELQGENNG